MGLSRLLVFVALLASATSSPIAQDTPDDDLLSPRTGDLTDAGPDSRAVEAPIIPSSSSARSRRNLRGPPTWMPQSSGNEPSPFGHGDAASPESSLGSPAPGFAKDEQTPVDDGTSYGAPRANRLHLQQPQPDASACTHTMFEPAVSPCAWNGVMTIYPSTRTAFKEVDCKGCSDVWVQKERYFCPIQRIEATQNVETPSTYWSTVCAASATTPQASVPTQASTQTADTKPLLPTPSPPQPAATQTRPFTTRMPVPTLMHPPQTTLSPVTTQLPATTPMPVLDLVRKPRDMGDQADPRLLAREADPVRGGTYACPTTFIVPPPMTAGIVWTVFAQTRTTTLAINCAGCPSLVTTTAAMGLGPVGRFKSTTTVPFGYTTVYKCL